LLPPPVLLRIMKRVMFPDVKAKDWSTASEVRGSLKFQDVEEKLMHSVVEHDKKEVNKGKLLSQAINQGFSSFHPDLMYEQIVKDYSMAQNLFGESLLRLVSGYEPDYIKRNITIPEFRRELKERLQSSFKDLTKDKFLSKDGELQDKAYELASLVLYTEELDHLLPKGFLGNKIHKRKSHYGERDTTRAFRKGDRYKDIAIKRTITTAIRRGHESLMGKDLQVSDRQSKGGIHVIYGMDASGSMKGKKIEMAKKAGIALAFKALQEKDHVGLLVFRDEIEEEIRPMQDFWTLLKALTKVKAGQQTNLVKMIKRSIDLFPSETVTKHLIILSDALPTIGKKPEEDTLKAVSEAKEQGVTISLVGIHLDASGKELGEKIAQLGDGKLYQVKQLEEMDTIILEDYYSVR